MTYEDGIAALEWLSEAFGFTETARYVTQDGRLAHGEAWSATPWIIDGVLVYVEDVDAHYDRAKAAGATVLSEPGDGPPARRYRVEDFEGHRWMFMAEE